MNPLKIEIEALKGVGDVQVELVADRHAYVLIGENGIGKTKTLEALFQCLFFNHSLVSKADRRIGVSGRSEQDPYLCRAVCFGDIQLGSKVEGNKRVRVIKHDATTQHNLPVVYLGSQNRGYIEPSMNKPDYLGTLDQRRAQYVEKILKAMPSQFAQINMNTPVEQWFVQLAQSSNPFMREQDSREVEIHTVLKMLHHIEPRIDPEFLEISGSGRVSIKVDGQKREFSHLSTGYASIVKILQTIVSGYGIFTNENNLSTVKGYVLIDEIESHLHLKWQVKILPMLKSLFPNTIFIVTTHSSLVTAQLEDGEAYKLVRNSKGVVSGHKLDSPGSTALIDILKEAFEVDLNRQKLDHLKPEDQKRAKQALLSIIQKDESQE